jgi:hypothetical protein
MLATSTLYAPGRLVLLILTYWIIEENLHDLQENTSQPVHHSCALRPLEQSRICAREQRLAHHQAPRSHPSAAAPPQASAFSRGFSSGSLNRSDVKPASDRSTLTTRLFRSNFRSGPVCEGYEEHGGGMPVPEILDQHTGREMRATCAVEGRKGAAVLAFSKSFLAPPLGRCKIELSPEEVSASLLHCMNPAASC